MWLQLTFLAYWEVIIGYNIAVAGLGGLGIQDIPRVPISNKIRVNVHLKSFGVIRLEKHAFISRAMEVAPNPSYCSAVFSSWVS